jgi:hypothetical protein
MKRIPSVEDLFSVTYKDIVLSFGAIPNCYPCIVGIYAIISVFALNSAAKQELLSMNN